MHVASTLWPNIKSQKISEHRFRLKWTKSSSRTQRKQAKTDQDQRGPDKEAKDSLLDEARGGWHPWAVGRPPWSADQARGPYRLNFAMCHILIGLLGRLCESHPVVPCYKYKEG